MAEHERRTHKFFGLSFIIPLPWLLGILAVGLVQFGVFFNQFSEFGRTLTEIKNIISTMNTAVTIHSQQIIEHERRLDKLEKDR